MSASTVSVALCTFNSARFLRPQLDSILAQTRLPDEVVISDDGSSDRTLEIAREFQSKASFRVEILADGSRLGFGQNFARAIRACRSELIFLCDHDDEWRADKIEIQARALEANPRAVLAISDATLVDAELRSLGTTTWKKIGFSEAERELLARGENYPLLLRKFVASGHAMAFPARLREILLPIPAGWPHDAWIPLVLGAIGRFIVIPEELVRYRQHPAQEVGLGASAPALRWRDRWQSLRSWTSEHNRRIADDARAVEARLQLFKELYPVSPINFHWLRDKILHFERRAAFPTSFLPRLFLVVRELLNGQYHIFENGFSSAAKDLFAKTNS